jgi:hypothetical protein
MYDFSLKIRFPRKSCIEIWVDSVGEFPHLSRIALNILLLQHPTCARLDFQQRQQAKRSSIL